MRALAWCKTKIRGAVDSEQMNWVNENKKNKSVYYFEAPAFAFCFAASFATRSCDSS